MREKKKVFLKKIAACGDKYVIPEISYLYLFRLLTENGDPAKPALMQSLFSQRRRAVIQQNLQFSNPIGYPCFKKYVGMKWLS